MTPRMIIPARTAGRIVSRDEMQLVYDQVKTPHKVGVILRGDENQVVDGPIVYRHDERWFMRYISSTNKVGYETFLATSDDLIHWTTLGKVLSFRESGWDKWQASAGMALQDTAWGGSYQLQTHDGQYWLGYMAGERQGYETDPLSIGMAHTDDPSQPREWTRVPQNPVLSPADPDVREFESVTLYKTNIVRDPERSLGYSFVMFYNGKNSAGCERIGMAVSDDMICWHRYGHEPVIANGKTSTWHISGNPQVTRIGDVWVMFYFGAFWKPKAFDTFACSYDLVTWTKWEGESLVAPSEDWDRDFAHKPWLIKHDGIVYHFFCAVGSVGRVIALATSEPKRF